MIILVELQSDESCEKNTSQPPAHLPSFLAAADFPYATTINERVSWNIRGELIEIVHTHINTRTHTYLYAHTHIHRNTFTHARTHTRTVHTPEKLQSRALITFPGVENKSCVVK